MVDTSGENNVWTSNELVQSGLAVHRDMDELFPAESQEFKIKEEETQVTADQIKGKGRWEECAVCKILKGMIVFCTAIEISARIYSTICSCG